jgi:pyruvate/2-oxoglutarate dehydrogenase complex dihydrolipoamide acyltransferase (E2) component
METETEKGFFASLFDLSFTSFVTPKMVKILYVLSLIMIALMYVGIAIAIFASGGTTTTDAWSGTTTTSGSNAGYGVAWLIIGGPLLALIYAIFARVFYELVIVAFRIYSTVHDEYLLLRHAHPAAAAELDAAKHAPAPAQAPPPPAQPPAPPAPPPPAPPAPPAPPTPPAV